MPNLRVPVDLKIDYLTTDLERRKFVRAKNLKFLCTAPQMGAMISRGKKLTDKTWVSGFVDRPVATFHGTGDMINHFDGTATFHEHLKVSDKKLFSYVDYYHDIFHEAADRAQTYLADIRDWLIAHSDKDMSKAVKETVTAKDQSAPVVATTVVPAPVPVADAVNEAPVVTKAEKVENTSPVAVKTA